jgi:Glutaminase
MAGSPVEDLIAAVHERFADERSGDILHGIPALEDVDPDSFGICLATVDGHVYEVGDTRLPFCIQSISKPFTYGIALTDRGVEAVDAKIEVEPSGELYNEIARCSRARSRSPCSRRASTSTATACARSRPVASSRPPGAARTARRPRRPRRHPRQLRRGRGPVGGAAAGRRPSGARGARQQGIGEGDPEVRATILNIFMFAIHQDVDRGLRALAASRVTTR